MRPLRSDFTGQKQSSASTACATEAAFLLDLIGRGVDYKGQPNHIVMLDDPPRPDDERDRKYKTVFRHPTLADCVAHLRGRLTIGGYMRHGEHGELTCGIAIDADDRPWFEVLWGMATPLRRSGARPLLETAPLPEGWKHAGGGKLWMVFDQLVRWQDALATVHRYAPDLRSLEHFPPARCRMPGGLYRRGLNKWCELSAFGAEDDTWYTGALAIQTIMENLTPATWVTERATTPAEGRGPIAEGPIPFHTRNRQLFRMGCSMRRAGFHEAAIFAALQVMSADRCDPPMDEQEVAGIAQSCIRYPPGAPTDAAAYDSARLQSPAGDSSKVRWLPRRGR